MRKTSTEEKAAKRKIWYEANKQRLIAKAAAWKKSNKKKVLEGQARYRKKAAAKIAAYNEKTRHQSILRSKNLYQKNKAHRLAYSRARYAEKKLEINKKNKAYKLANSEKMKANNKAYHRKRLDTDFVYRLKCNLRKRVANALKGVGSKSAHTMELIGCSGEFLRDYLATKFKDGMHWGNYGQWHVDHKKPLVKFNLADAIEQRKAFHFSNMQPLWALDNRMKAAKENWVPQ